MKNLFTGAIAMIMLVTACKKKDEGLPANTWTIGSNSYTATSITASAGGSSYRLLATNGAANISFTFNGSGTPSAGTYRVVGTGIPGSGEVSMATSIAATTTAYLATGNDAVNATVSLQNGKLTIQMPEAWARKAGGTDSLKVSANLTQQ